MKRTGFTLVEILIVVIILGILAAIVIPQFTEASNDARESALASDLQTLRSQLELYKVQHLERYPSVNESNAADTANFINRLTGKTDQDGRISDTGTFGPYMQKFPTNGFVAIGGNLVTFIADPAGAVPGGNFGWCFNTSNGKMLVNDTAHTGL